MKVILAIWAQMFASTWTALGYATQKKAHEIARTGGKPWLKQLRWWFGLGIMQIGVPMNFIALLWADQSLLCTLAPFSIILSLVFGRFMLKETIYIQHYVSVGLMIMGSILSMFFTSKISHNYNIDEIKSRVLSLSSITCIGINLSLMTIFMTCSYFIIRDIKRLSKYFSENEAQNWLLKSSSQTISDDMTTTSIDGFNNGKHFSLYIIWYLWDY